MSRSSSHLPALRLERAGAGDLEVVRELAGVIWRAVYPGIISSAQIEYMLKCMYAANVMRREVSDESVDYFLILSGEDPSPMGFAAIGPGEKAGEAILHKLYLHPSFHGHGYGTAALKEIEDFARKERSTKAIILRVNRENRRAIRSYRRNGFEVIGEICSDIGDGFVMDDYWMRKELPAGSQA